MPQSGNILPGFQRQSDNKISSTCLRKSPVLQTCVKDIGSFGVIVKCSLQACIL